MLCSPFCHFYLPIYPCILVETLIYRMLTLCFRLDVFLCMETHVSQVMIDMNYLQLIYFAAGAWNLQPPWLWDWWVPKKSTIASLNFLNDRSCGYFWIHRSIQQDVGFSNKSWLLVQDKKGALKCRCASEIGYDTLKDFFDYWLLPGPLIMTFNRASLMCLTSGGMVLCGISIWETLDLK